MTNPVSFFSSDGLWNDFVEHCQKAKEGSLGSRTVHVLIAGIELFPVVVSQVYSLFKVVFTLPFSSSESEEFLVPLRNPLNDTPHRENVLPLADMGGVEPLRLSTPLGNFRRELLENLPGKIVEQNINPTYERDFLLPLGVVQRNMPVPLLSGATFYAYNAEGIHDYGWGCAWRAIQTSLSTYGVTVSFEELFHLFGPLENLKLIYKEMYPREELCEERNRKFAGYRSGNGWADPFIGQMVLQFYDIPSKLELVHGIPRLSNTPVQVFHHPVLNFQGVKMRLITHFENPHAAPVIIDDGIYTFNVIGAMVDPQDISQTILSIADPHIKEGVNRGEEAPVGLYTVTLNHVGHQISHSIRLEDLPKMFDGEKSAKAVDFESKQWSVLFPLSRDGRV